MRAAFLLALLSGCTGLYSATDGGSGGGGGGSGGGGPCMREQDCDVRENATAACTNGTCTYACAQPFFKCGSVCCRATAVSAGDTHTCLLTDVGSVKCWGGSALIGDGTYEERLVPTDVVGLTAPVVELATGSTHTCARLNNGNVECWGIGTMGNGTTSPAPQATRALLGGPATRITAGIGHSCAVIDGGAYCWGTDIQGQQGTNNGGARLTPGGVSNAVYDVASAASGASHSCVLLADAGARCWGFNIAGECGDGTFQMKRPVPVDVTALDAGILELKAGFSFTCARVSNGLKCWGANGGGELGAGIQSGRSVVGVDVVGVTAGLTQLALGPLAHHACVVQDAGAFCWGQNSHGQLGDGMLARQLAPVRVMGLSEPVAQLAVGGGHTCALTEPGGVYCWGDNSDGQLGLGKKGGNELIPKAVR